MDGVENKQSSDKYKWDGKYWGGFADNSSSFTSPYLLGFEEVEKLSKNAFVPASTKNKSAKNENAITTQM